MNMPKHSEGPHKVLIRKGALAGREAEVKGDSPQKATVQVHPDGSPPNMELEYKYEDVTFLE